MTTPHRDESGGAMTDLDTVISLGAGVQSTTLALMAAAGEIDDLGPRPRLAIFADTGWEPREVYEHLDRLQPALEAGGLEVARVSAGNIREDTIARGEGEKSRYANIPVYVGGTMPAPCPDCTAAPSDDDPLTLTVIDQHLRANCPTCDGTGRHPTLTVPIEGTLRRQCTREYKIDPITRHLRSLGYGPKQHVTQYMGISLDEIQRMKPTRIAWQHAAWPLIDKRMTRADCHTWLTDHGWTAPRSACIGCPYHSDHEWRRIRDTDPDAWADAIAFDEYIRTNLPGLDGEAYLHRQRVPLADVDLTTAEDAGQTNLFDAECEGMCGV